MNDVLTLSARMQARLIRQREISPVELVEAHLAQIAQINPRLNAVTELLAESAVDAALAADQAEPRGPLHGVPFSVKDSIEVAGTVCTAGTIGRREAAASSTDADLVERLRGAGAIPLAKTNLPDLLFAFETDNLLFGRTNNPYDLTCTSGGSSGGEASLITACGSPMGLGSDCAGSVRLPAAFCGIAGIKPTTGRLSRTGHFPPAGGWIQALWQIGPMARRVEDLVVMMSVLAPEQGGVSRGDPAAVGLEFRPFDERGMKNLRVAWYVDNGFAHPDAEVRATVRAAAEALTGEVRSIEERRPSCVAAAYDLEMKLIGADGGDSLRAYAASLGSSRVHPLLTGWLDKLEAYRTDLPGFQSYWSQWDSYTAEMNEFFSELDAIVCPVYTSAALPHGASIEDANFRGFSHAMAFNLCGLPAATLRCGTSSAGLPIGVQVVARPWREDVALAIAAALETALGGWKPPSAFATNS